MVGYAVEPREHLCCAIITEAIMNIEISSASQYHSAEFKTLIELLVQRFLPVQIHCFAKLNTTYTTRSCFTEAIDNCKQDYFLLLVMEETIRIEHEIQDFTNAHFKNGVVTVLAHGKKTVLESLEAGNMFFTSIYQRGTLLYSSDVIMATDVSTPYSATNSFVDEESHLDQRLSLIEGFLSGARECLCKEQYNACLFMLHQAVEQCCLALIRIHLGYRSDIHNLRRLLQLCCCFSPEPMKVFISRAKEDDRLFNILAKNYSKARYADGFLADKKDVQLLYHRIDLFFELTKSMCNKKVCSAV